MLSELWSDVRYRARALFRRDAVERELDDELRFHLEEEMSKYERAGIPRHEAWRRARITFGGVERAKEESRAARGTMLIESTLQDLRFAVRGLRAAPSFAAGVILTLGLGIGANATMFGIVDRLLFRPPAYLHDADRVHRVFMSKTVDGTVRAREGTSWARYRDIARWTRSFDAIGSFMTLNVAVGDGDAVRRVPVAGVTASYLDFFDARPPVGRWFTRAEDVAPQGAPVVVLSYAYWQTQLGGNPNVLGRRIRIGHTLCSVIGVAPPGFIGMEDESVPALFVPMTTMLWDARPGDYTRNYGWGGRVVIVRRKPGISIEMANADLTQAYINSYIAAGDSSYSGPLAAARPHAFAAPVELARGPDAGPMARVAAWVAGIAIIVLLVACANVANLLLARAVNRRREIALRLALGVSRARLLRQVLTETLVLAVAGGVLGLIVARWGGATVRTLFLPTEDGVTVFTDGRTLVATAAATVVAAIMTAFVPAAQALKQNLAESLTAGGRDTGSRHSSTRAMLLMFQAAFSVLLLVGAGLFVRSLTKVRTMHLGYDVDRILVVTRNSRGVRMTPAQQIALDERMTEAARATPGVDGAASAPSIPFWAFEGRRLSVPGIDSAERRGDFSLQAADTSYFRTVGTRLLRGRAFDASDRLDSPPVVIVGEGMAHTLWPGQTAIGKCIRIWLDGSQPNAPESSLPCRTVVGVVEDVHNRSFSDPHQFMYYVPLAQYHEPTSMVFVRVDGSAADAAESVRWSMQRVMPGAAYVTATPLRAIVDPEMQSWRTGAMMFVAFGGLALILAAVGLYSVIAYSVAQRRRELGVRIALGALPGDVVTLVLRGGLRTLVAGIGIGSVLALVAGRWAAGMLFQESPSDPAVYATVAGALLVVSLVAMALPARAATRVDATTALRAD